MYAGKPIIGLSGGIGAGKSFVGRLFAELGCLVISSDALVQLAYGDPDIRQTLRDWWGESICSRDGELDRRAISRRIFENPQDRLRLESLIHPKVAQRREAMMASGAADEKVVAYVWDTPLLFETQLNRVCDATVFVDAPDAVRLQRVRDSRGWEAAELARRENSQLPLDKKRGISNYIVVNATDADLIRVQVRELLSRILAGASHRFGGDPVGGPICGHPTQAS